jgi:tRNA (guanine-N7-)-methyltransferase
MDDKPVVNTNTYRKPIRSFVLRQTRMTQLQQRAFEELQCFIVPFGNSSIQLPKEYTKAVLEIGFGMGHATAEIARANPQVMYYGIEVHTPGVGALLARIKDYDLDNIRIIQHDALEVLDSMIPFDSLHGVHLFFPDPWPKKKHHKRRIVNLGLLEKIIPRLKTGGYFYAVTDWQEYAEEILDKVGRIRGFHNTFQGFAEPQLWRPQTAFEHKGFAKNHKIYEIYVEKIDV